MLLLNLPPEVLALIFLHSTLRTSATNLLVSKQWYLAALPIYLSGIDLTVVYLSSLDLGRLPPAHSALGSLIQANVRQLSLRLIGYPSMQKAKRPWISDDIRASEGDISDGDDNDADGAWAGDLDYKDEPPLLVWKRMLNKQLEGFADLLSGCTALEELSLEASNTSDSEDALGYIYDSSLKKIITSLPPGLVRLTFDPGGSKIVSSAGDDTMPIHLCPLLARRLKNIQHVRLRMRSICTEVLNVCGTKDEDASQLRTLIVRLSLPYFPDQGERWNNKTSFDAVRCVTAPEPVEPSKPPKLYRDMVRAGINTARNMPSIRMLRISFRGSGINLYAVDCLTRREMFDPCEVFVYEDDGREWAAWEEKREEDFIVGNIFR